MDNYFEINNEIQYKFLLNEKYSVSKIIDSISNFDPLEVKAVITQGIMNNNYVIVKASTQFVNSIIKIVNHQKYKKIETKKSSKNVIAISIPPFHKSTLTIKMKEEGIEFIQLYDLFSQLIKKANKSIKICSPFFDLKNLMEFQNLLIKKATEGVEVQVLTRELNDGTSGDTQRKKSLKKFRERLISPQLKKNIFIKNYHFEDENKKVLSSIHSKIIIIDGREAYIGSGELRANSFIKNFELGLSIDDEIKVRSIETIFDTLFLIAKKI